MREPKPRVTLGRYSLAGAPGFMCKTVAIARRPRRLSEAMNFLAAARPVTVNPPGSGFDGPGHASCEEMGMATQTTNRRESDRVPMGVEAALPWIPVPSRKQRLQAKSSGLRKLVLTLLALVRKG